MRGKLYNKLIHVGEYVAEVPVELIVEDDEWSPYLRVEDALKLDLVREMLLRADVKSAVELAVLLRWK